VLLFCVPLQGGQCLKPRLLEFADPPFGDLVERHRVEVVQLLPSPPHGADQVGGLQDGDVLGGRLAGHGQLAAQFTQRLPVALVQAVEQLPPGRVGQRLEDLVRRCGHDSLCR